MENIPFGTVKTNEALINYANLLFLALCFLLCSSVNAGSMGSDIDTALKNKQWLSSISLGPVWENA